MSKHSEVACLSKASIFKNLPLSLKKKLVTITSHQDFFPKGSLIRQPLDGQDGMIVIDSGHAKVYSLNEDGKETVLGVLAKGDSTGQENLFSQKDHENFIQATEDCLVCSMNRQDFQKMLNETPDLSLTLRIGSLITSRKKEPEQEVPRLPCRLRKKTWLTFWD